MITEEKYAYRTLVQITGQQRLTLAAASRGAHVRPVSDNAEGLTAYSGQTFSVKFDYASLTGTGRPAHATRASLSSRDYDRSRLSGIDSRAKVGEEFGVSQSTVSRAISVITPLLAEVMSEFTPTADDLDPEAQYIVDGTLLPCWSWKDRPELYSGKHKATGVNVQVDCSIYGQLSWISDPVSGNHHDNYCLGDSGALLTMNPED